MLLLLLLCAGAGPILVKVNNSILNDIGFAFPMAVASLGLISTSIFSQWSLPPPPRVHVLPVWYTNGNGICSGNLPTHCIFPVPPGSQLASLPCPRACVCVACVRAWGVAWGGAQGCRHRCRCRCRCLPAPRPRPPDAPRTLLASLPARRCWCGRWRMQA